MTIYNNSQITLTKFQAEFNHQFKKFFNQMRQDILKIAPACKILIDTLEEFAFRPSKRLRPAFLYFGYIAAGGNNYKAALQASLSVELLQTFALIHDDLIDKAEIRRGKPTIDLIFEKAAPKNISDKKHFGKSAAILLGDLSFTYADQLLTSSNFPQDTILSAKKYYDFLRSEVIFGEYLDILLVGNKKATKDQIIKMLILKSAKYSIERPLHIGAALAKAKEDIFKAYSNYAIPLGLAFQIQDDILGIYGDPKTTGKSSNSDILEGKNTLIISNTREKISQKDKIFLDSILANPKATRSEIKKLKKAIIDSGALSQTKKEVQDLILKSKRALGHINLEKNAKNFLIEIANYIGTRLN